MINVKQDKENNCFNSTHAFSTTSFQLLTLTTQAVKKRKVWQNCFCKLSITGRAKSAGKPKKRVKRTLKVQILVTKFSSMSFIVSEAI